MKSLLSIDWDFITGDCAEKQGCCGWCTPTPRERTRGQSEHISEGWIKRLSSVLNLTNYIYPASNLYVAECHADILRVVNPFYTKEIFHLDSHFDLNPYYSLCCGSWRTFLPKGVAVKPVYEKDLERFKGSFDNVFICQSSPWTPVSLDKFFWNMIKHFSSMMKQEPEFIGHRRVALAHKWIYVQDSDAAPVLT